MKARLVESKLRFLKHKRKPLHASLLYKVPNLRTPKLQASFEAPTFLIVGILEEASFYKPF